jgi:hypothetical protein
MRELKFRVWNKATGTMHYPDWEELAIRAKLPEMELMQYTGLKDMNGKEIYEGDILAGEYISFKVQVIYYDGTYETVSSVGHYRSLSEFSGCAVVGNIYENPELLEGK